MKVLLTRENGLKVIFTGFPFTINPSEFMVKDSMRLSTFADLDTKRKSMIE